MKLDNFGLLKESGSKKQSNTLLASPHECQLDQPEATIETFHLTCSSL